MRGPHGCGRKGTYCYDTPISVGAHRGVGIFGDGWFLQNRNARAEVDGREELRVDTADYTDPGKGDTFSVCCPSFFLLHLSFLKER